MNSIPVSLPMESALYALLVGINDYLDKPLQGCLTDQQSLITFLHWYQPDTTQLHIKTLTNEEATRQGIINGFSHFEQAGPNDVCLFYFSGHGSFTTAPRGFYSPINRFHQTLVCWDSRRPNGRDLMDKELAFLIWKYSIGRQKPNLRFVVITDSCHSGSVTRELTEGCVNNLRERTVEPGSLIDAKDYYGYHEMVNGQRGYIISEEEGDERIRVETGPHIHLAAARDSQTAKENRVEGEIRGLFTYSLLKTLQESKGRIDYAELIRRTEIHLKTTVSDQNPMMSLEGIPSEAARNQFLQDNKVPFQRNNLLYFSEQRGWCIDTGSLLGASEGDEVRLENNLKTVITEVFPEESTILEKTSLGLDQHRHYKVTLLPQQLTRFALNMALSLVTKALLKQIDTTGLPLKLVEDGDGQAHFQIRANGDQVYVSGLADSKPLFKERTFQTEADAALFIEDLHTFCAWNQLLILQNPTTTLESSDVKLTVTRAVKAPNPIYDPATFQLVTDVSKPINLYYFNDESPAIQIRVENQSDRELWFQPFYLGFDYSISNNALTAISLQPGDATTLTYIYKGKRTDIIRFQVDPIYQKLGYTEILEHIKLIISTQPLEAIVWANYNQNGLRLAEKSAKEMPPHATFIRSTKGLDPGIDVFAKDWLTATLAFQICYPAKGAMIPAGGHYEARDISIQVPTGFETRFAWNSTGEVKRSLGGIASPDQVLGNAALEPLNWLTTRGETSPLNVLELYAFTNREAISPEQPLLIKFKVSAATSIVSLVFDPETGLYFSAGSQLSDGTVAIHTLPDTSSSQRSLSGSIKIFFYKIVLSKVGITYDYPRLALAKLTNDMTVEYETDTECIRETLQSDSVKHVLLFTHGIIGDTLDMTKAARLALMANGKPIETKVDAILTFDYENLNTRIQDNARLLKQRLIAVGINPQDNKQVTILAHSMGGLISRWLIEKLEGNALIDRLIMCGTPNNGTPLADIRDAVEVLLTFAVNGAAALKPWLFGINLLGRVGSDISVSFKQMDIQTGIYEELNDGTDPGVPYTIIAGDIRQIRLNLIPEMNLIQKLFTRLGRTAKYGLLDKLLFKAPNDIAVGTKSIKFIPGSQNWSKETIIHTVACDHLNYFINPDSLKILGSCFD